MSRKPYRRCEPGALRPAHGGLDQLGAGPVVQLPVGDAGGAGRHRTAIADLVVHVGQAVGEEEICGELRFAGQFASFHARVLLIGSG